MLTIFKNIVFFIRFLMFLKDCQHCQSRPQSILLKNKMRLKQSFYPRALFLVRIVMCTIFIYKIWQINHIVNSVEVFVRTINS